MGCIVPDHVIQARTRHVFSKIKNVKNKSYTHNRQIGFEYLLPLVWNKKSGHQFLGHSEGILCICQLLRPLKTLLYVSITGRVGNQQ